jgi:glutamate N-acetyltransferase / amino-acid N-acetyltransferase
MGFEKISGGVCAPRGFSAGASASGLKESGDPDLCIVLARERCAAAGTFTLNAFKAAPVLVTMEHVSRDGFLQAAVVNAGNANAWTGERGMEDARSMAELTARKLGIEPADVAVASTGVIGRYLNMGKVASGIERAAARLVEGDGADAARAIMTTDTYAKETALQCGGFKVGGMAKGSGMIKPDMATMLAFITTDAEVEPELSRALRSAVDRTFNRISVDGCTSTNDMVLAMAGGASGVRLRAEEIAEPLFRVCSDLARSIVGDGEGATRFITVRVHGAKSGEEAERAAMAVAESALVKTAFFGGDPNWGRVVQALGQAVKDADPRRVSVLIGGVVAAASGAPADNDRRALEAAAAEREITLDIYLGRGAAGIEVWTCDFSYEYVRINADYHT